MQLLLSGVDTVECAYFLRPGIGCRLDYQQLAVARESLRNAKVRESQPVALGSKQFMLAPHGTGSGYPLLLTTAEMALQCGEFNSPSFFVTYRSHALWHQGAQALHQGFVDWATELRLHAVRAEALSRVDFSFDVHLPALDFDADSFVTLASKDAQHRKDRKTQTFRFGEGDVVLRVYDKAAEIRESSQKDWFYALWGGCTEHVWRVEFQVRKDVLRRFSIRTFSDLEASAGDLLRYLMHEHTTLRVKGDDSNRSRWLLHPLWAMLRVESAKLNAQGVLRSFDAEEALRERLMRLAISVEGYVKRAAAVECIRQGRSSMSHDAALATLAMLLKQVHDPLSWSVDVGKRIDQMRLGQW